MTLTKYERGSTFKTTVTWMSSSTYVDPSGQKSYLDVYDSLGTKIFDSVEGSKESTGIYKYYVSTNSTDPLGVYVVDWWARFNYGTPWNYETKHERSEIQISYLD